MTKHYLSSNHILADIMYFRIIYVLRRNTVITPLCSTVHRSHRPTDTNESVSVFSACSHSMILNCDSRLCVTCYRGDDEDNDDGDDDEWEDTDEEGDFDSEGGFSDDEDTKGGGHGREFLFMDEETKSRFTEYSMTSSVMRRNEQLTLLDDRFEKVNSRDCRRYLQLLQSKYCQSALVLQDLVFVVGYADAPDNDECCLDTTSYAVL